MLKHKLLKHLTTIGSKLIEQLMNNNNIKNIKICLMNQMKILSKGLTNFYKIKQGEQREK